MTRARRLAIALAAALTAPPAAGAQLVPLPGPTLEHSNVALSARIWRGATLVGEDVAVIPPGGPGIVNELYQAPGLQRFPTSASLLPAGFASAIMTGGGFGGVGVSFWSPQTPDVVALTVWGQSVTNVGGGAAALHVDYSIPAIEVSLLAGPSYGPFPTWAMPTAAAGARLTATHYAADGSELSTTIVFDYFLSIARRWAGDGVLGIHEITVSDDLAAHRPTEWLIVDEGDVSGVYYLPFARSAPLPTLAAGERLILNYSMLAESLASYSQTPELGYQALVGDPFQVGATGGLTVRLTTPTAVPEPATVLLLGAGLVATAVARRRPRRAS